MSVKRRNDVLLSKIGNRIKQLRTEKGITQEVFFNDTGIHIARIEVAKRDFNMTTLNEICNYLDVSMETFLKGL